jgi:hypothetical protein
MNLKVANLVAVQFGVFVGIMSWLAYSQLPLNELRSAAERREPPAAPVATLASASSPGDQSSQTVDYRPDQEQTEPIAEPPAPAMHQYSAAAVQQYTALAAQQYYQQIAPRRYASSGGGSGYIAAAAPSYAEVEQEPAAIPDYPAAETVAYVQPAQIVAYPQPQFVVFSDSPRFANRCRPAPPFIGAPLATRHRRLDQTSLPLSAAAQFERRASPSAALRRPTQSLGGVHRRNDKASSCRPIEGCRPRGRR